MSDSTRQTNYLRLGAIAAVGFAVPSSVIFALETSLGGKPFLQAIEEIGRRQFADGDNLFLLAGIGLIPFVALDGILWLVSTTTKDLDRMPWLAVAGLVGILALMVPTHVAVWLPLYTHHHASSTSAIAFLFIPFYCCVTLAIGLGVGEWLFRRHCRRRRSAPPQPTSGAGADN